MRTAQTGPSLGARMHDHDLVYHAPFAQGGRVVGIDDAYLHVSVGHTTMQFALVDLARAFPDAETATRILGNAVAYHDHIELHLADGRLTYDNPSQFARIPKDD